MINCKSPWNPVPRGIPADSLANWYGCTLACQTASRAHLMEYCSSTKQRQVLVLVLQQPVSVICFRTSWIKTPSKMACLMRQKNMMCQICASLWGLVQTDLKAGQHSLWSFSSWHHAWEEDRKSWTYVGLCRSLSVLWGYYYIHWGQWQGSPCHLWVHSQGVLNCTQKQGEVLLESW